MAGQRARCPKCGTVNQVPAAPAAGAGEIRLGPYKVMRKIGEGKMGAVYEAIQDGADRRVALKVLPQRLMGDSHSLERFQREAHSAAGLKHPNIIAAYDIGRDKGYIFFSMELVDGENLKERLKRDGKFPAPEALSLIRQVAEAMDYAWKHGKIIHRDLKLDNIMLARDGGVKVADFGLAKSTMIVTEVTAPGTAIGSPEYMAPEQFTSARDVDCRADVYSLGITLFTILTGRRPFQEKTAMDYLHAHRDKAFPDPRQIEPGIPEGVCQLLWKMCAKKPEDRYQTPEQLLAEVMQLQGVSPAAAVAQEEAVASTAEAAEEVESAAEQAVQPALSSAVEKPVHASLEQIRTPASVEPVAESAVGSQPPVPAEAAAARVEETQTWVEADPKRVALKQRRRKWLIAAAIILTAILGMTAIFLLMRIFGIT